RRRPRLGHRTVALVGVPFSIFSAGISPGGDMSRALVVCLAAMCLANPGAAGDKTAPKSLAGYWQGTLKAGLIPLRLVIHVQDKDGALTATMDSPDENLKDLAITDPKIEDSAFSFAMKLTGAKFEGKLNEGRTEIAGKWKQRGLSFPLTFTRLDRKPNF